MKINVFCKTIKHYFKVIECTYSFKTLRYMFFNCLS